MLACVRWRADAANSSNNIDSIDSAGGMQTIERELNNDERE